MRKAHLERLNQGANKRTNTWSWVAKPAINEEKEQETGIHMAARPSPGCLQLHGVMASWGCAANPTDRLPHGREGLLHTWAVNDKMPAELTVFQSFCFVISAQKLRLACEANSDHLKYSKAKVGLWNSKYFAGEKHDPDDRTTLFF